tara:strand:+ start:1456 stop:2139 length:684 start_codon:yes stop_codon:yes gene_type:complete
VKGKLYVVATPIGNLEDITFRAIDTLKKVDCIAAEDTRVSYRLLKKYEIKKELIPFHVKNENSKVEYIVELLLSGKNVAIISDAGTPCISDPGYLLINKARNLDIDVYSIPGASSVTSALSVAGLPSERFFFEGFLPKKKGRVTRMSYLSSLDVSIVLFESPYRMIKTLNDILNIMGDRFVSVCKELTKINESNYYGKVSRVILDFDKMTKVKGEYVIIVAKESYDE